MTSPVNLSRERWEMLYRDVGVSYPLDKIRLAFPAEIEGIVFLPAEYVPGGQSRPSRVFKLLPPPCA